MSKICKSTWLYIPKACSQPAGKGDSVVTIVDGIDTEDVSFVDLSVGLDTFDWIEGFRLAGRLGGMSSSSGGVVVLLLLGLYS